MQVKNNSFIHHSTLYLNDDRFSCCNSARKYSVKSFVQSPAFYPNTIGDKFVKSENFDRDINFTGFKPLEGFIRLFLKHKTFKTSIRGSKRPYLELDCDLSKITKKVKINVTKNEKIEALDINPNNSGKYIIFLHGFSQNITNNQPLYKVLKDTNFGLLAIDYRGYGHNKFSFNIYERHIDKDISSAISYLTEKGVNEIGLVGHSFGSYLAARTSKKREVNFQILISPMTSLEFWKRKVLNRPKANPVELYYIKYIPGFKEQYLKVFNISKHLKGNSTPTYLIHSNKDMYIRTPKVNRLAEDISNLQKYILLKHGGHKMDDTKILAIKEVLDSL